MITREAIVQEALSWVGTPFHHHAGVKGAGCDCVHLLFRVHQAVGLIPADEKLPAYKPQWFQHRDEPVFLMGLEKYAVRTDTPLAGDVAMYNFGRHAAHSGIIIDGHTIVHAYLPVRSVTRGDRRELEPRLDSYWTIFR